jgi:hypothetical protein
MVKFRSNINSDLRSTILADEILFLDVIGNLPFCSVSAQGDIS